MTGGVFTKRISQNISQNMSGHFACFAVSEGTLGCRGKRGPQRGQRAVEEAEGRRKNGGLYWDQMGVEVAGGCRGDIGPWIGQMARKVAEGRRWDTGPERVPSIVEGNR